MTEALSNQADKNMAVIENVLINGDLSELKPAERIEYYNRLCTSLGLNPLTKPFAYLQLKQNGKEKLVLYALKDCTDQLRKNHNINLRITARELIGDIYVVTAQAKTPTGREDESTGAVPVKGLSGDMLANAYMKAETKAKRRVSLSVCGMGMLDETETETIKDAKPFTEAEPARMPAASSPPKQAVPAATQAPAQAQASAPAAVDAVEIPFEEEPQEQKDKRANLARAAVSEDDQLAELVNCMKMRNDPAGVEETYKMVKTKLEEKNGKASPILSGRFYKAKREILNSFGKA